ncbi:hypothetical protein C8246_07215 [Paracidovorax avenae]|nr:hypothetical protein C8246_07215 [Paracidovorax avenae]
MSYGINSWQFWIANDFIIWEKYFVNAMVDDALIASKTWEIHQVGIRRRSQLDSFEIALAQLQKQVF